jgi:transcriptional regulator with XRE-family HTH domain
MGTDRRERLSQRRIMMGFSQEHLAAVLGIERSTVARWEQGVTEPRPWQRPELARQLQVTPDELAELLADMTPVVRQPAHDEPDLVTSVPWSHQGTVEAAAELTRGDDVELINGWCMSPNP